MRLPLRRLPLMAALAVSAGIAAEPAGVWLDVPFVEQTKEGCGSAALAMLLRYWGLQADGGLIHSQLYEPRAQGITASAMVGYLEARGFKTFVLEGSWPLLKDHLQKGRPLLVRLKPGGGRSPLHYVLVTGLDWDRNLVILNDPAQRKLMKMDRARFEKTWSDRWTVLAVPEQTK